MCLAVPGKVVSLDNNNSYYKSAKVSFGGVIKEICIDFTPDVVVGDYVLVHVGFALNQLDETEALETIELISEMEKAAVQ
ncbi:MAG: hydrogenase assembly chaperone hypC/hupF [Ignavibacteria bacterium]|nr:hydrogenase assembly chaperone hypC/hupF [Ignavibacteria bacterium]